MLIAGFQKNSFVDYPKKIAAVVFTPGCNMRCWYCHNRHIIDGAPEELFAEEYVLDFLHRRQGMLDAVVITGGEPTLQQNLVPFIDMVRDLGYLVKLDTNGTNPQLLASLLSSGRLDYVAMDIKAPLEKYDVITPLMAVDMAKVRQSINLLRSSDVESEFRTTFAPNLTVDDAAQIAREIEGTKHYYIQQYRPRDGEDAPSHAPDTIRAAAAAAAAILGEGIVGIRGL